MKRSLRAYVQKKNMNIGVKSMEKTKVYGDLMDAYAERAMRIKFVYSQIIKPGDIVFDIGANHGNRSEIMIELGAKTIAVEPLPKCAKELRERFKDKITVVEAACGSKPDQLPMKVCNWDDMSSLSDTFIDKLTPILMPDTKWYETITVPVVTLDDLIKQYGVPSFLKIDVEGWEFEVIKGLHTPIKTIAFEYSPFLLDVAINTIEHLDNLAHYRYNYSRGDSMVMELPEDSFSATLIKELVKWPEYSGYGDIYAFRMDS